MKFKSVYRGSIDLSQHLSDVIGVSEEVLISLQADDDWSFIVKSYAIMESIVTNLVFHSLGNHRLQRHIDKLHMNSASGKLNLAADLGLIDKESNKVCELFSIIRNQFVHSTDWMSSDLDQYIADQSGKNLENLRGKLPKLESPEAKEDDLDLEQLLTDSPRETLFICLVYFIGATA